MVYNDVLFWGYTLLSILQSIAKHVFPILTDFVSFVPHFPLFARTSFSVYFWSQLIIYVFYCENMPFLVTNCNFTDGILGEKPFFYA